MAPVERRVEAQDGTAGSDLMLHGILRTYREWGLPRGETIIMKEVGKCGNCAGRIGTDE